MKPLNTAWTGLDDVKYQFYPAMLILDLEQADYDILKDDNRFRLPLEWELSALYGYHAKQ